MRAVCLLLVVASSACLGAAVKPIVSAAPGSLALACPAAADEHPNPDVCVSVISGDGLSLGEPNVAIDPRNPGTVAVGVNVLQEGSPAGSPACIVAPLCPAATSIGPPGLFVSRDGGGSWAAHALPPIAGGSYGGDPTLAYDARGILHFGGLWTDGKIGGVFHVATTDGGETWTTPAVLTKGEDADRPWLSAAPDGTLWFTWQATKPPAVHVARSRDGGQTWERILGDAPYASCNLQTAVTFPPGGPILACNHNDGHTVATHILRVLDGGLEPVSTLPGAGGTIQMKVASWDALVLAMPVYRDGRATIEVRTSRDGGRTWPYVTDVARVAHVDDAWGWIWLGAVAPDAWGLVHVMIAGGAGDPCFNARCPDAVNRRDVAYVAIEPGTGAVVFERLLTPAGHHTSRSSMAQTNDDYASAAFSSEAGVLAWGYDHAIMVARVDRADDGTPQSL